MCLSCTKVQNKPNDVQENEIPDSAVIIYEGMVNDTSRTIYIMEKKNGLKGVFVHDSNREQADRELHLRYYRSSSDEDMYEKGLLYSVYYVVSPDKRYTYVVTSVGACGSGFLTEHQLYRIDVQTLSCIMIKDCVTVACNKDGFVMIQGNITNEETATTTAAFEYDFYFEYYDWSGKFVRKGLKQPTWVPDDYEHVFGFKKV